MLFVLIFVSAVALPSDGLADRIEFWKSVFTEYGENDLIFHDRRHVHLIYDVLNLEAEGIKPGDQAGRRQTENRYRKRIEEALTEIDAHPRSQWSRNANSIAKKIDAAGVGDRPRVLLGRIHVQRGIRERFAEGLKRYSLLGGTVKGILREEGIPEFLAALPLVESGYLNSALSRTGAAGVWQFMPSTARLYMKVTANVDQRLDLPISTRSAARLLKNNYAALGTWPLAITAYNHGLTGVKRAKNLCGEHVSEIINCYNGPSFGYASSNFYTEFLAALAVLNEHPASVAPAAPVARYRIQPGDTLLRISRKFSTTPERIMSLNGMKDSNRLIAGRILLVPKG